MFGFIGAQILILAWVPVVMLVFMLLPSRRRAMVATAVAAWQFLPPAQIDLPGFPDFSKTTSAVLGILLATIIFEPSRIFSFRPRLVDLPMLVFCLCPFVSSMTNDLGAYNGISRVVGQCTSWLLPYWIGRLYLTDVASFRELGMAMIVGGVCLIPLCLFEIRFSPVLQPMLFNMGKFEGLRFDGYRPRVFFFTGLDLGLWMNSVTLVAGWFWHTGQFKRLLSMSSGMIFAMLLVVTILCRSTGATLLLTSAFLALMISLRTRTKWAFWCLLAIAPLYCSLRATNLWSGQSAVQLAQFISVTRADSFDYRLENEDFLIAKALQQPIFGWGGWGRNLVYDQAGDMISTPDGLWVIIFGTLGYVGLASMTLAMLLPSVQFLARFPVERWNQSSLAAVVVIAAVLDLFLIDSLVNAMPNVIYVIAAGGLLNIVPSRVKLGTSDHDGNAAMAAKSWEAQAAQYRARGRASKDQGRLVEAKADWFHALDLYTKLVAIQPSRPAPHQQWCDCANDLAWLLVNTADPAVNDPDLALSLAVKTTEGDPECSTYWNTLGVAYYRTGDFQSASAALDRSMAVGDGGSAFDYLFLTMTHARLGDQQHAHHWFAKAMDAIERHHPDHPELGRLCAEARSLLSSVPEDSSILH